MSKIVLTLNSHSLSDYQKCPRRYEYNALIQIEPAQTKKVFLLGTFWGKMMEIYYRAKIKYGDKWGDNTAKKLEILCRRMAKCAESESNEFTENERNLLATRILLYHKFYAAENWKPIAVETGFSIVLYEDDKYVFIYEGRPDRVMTIPNPFRPYERVVCISDDKTRAKNIDLVDFNNQVNGYLVAAKTNWFIYNYMGKQNEGGPSKYFQRQVVHRDDAALDRWKENTIKWYWRIINDMQINDFPQSMQCPGEYSNCEFLPLCSADTESEYNVVMANRFKKREEARKSW